MKNKILIIIIAFNLLSFSASAITKPPFDNISISKKPVQYKEIVFEDFDGKLINLKNNSSQPTSNMAQQNYVVFNIFR